MKHRYIVLLLCTLGLASIAHADALSDLQPSDLQHLSLSQAERLLQANNREVLFARRALEGSQADKLSAGQKPNPVLSLSSTNFKLHGSNGNGGLQDKTLDSIVRVDQLIERGGKRELRTAVAEDAIKASRFDLQDSMRQQTLNLRSSYYDLLLAQQAELLQQENQAIFDKVLQSAELRLKAGDISATDVARIRVDALRAKNDVRQAQADREKAQAILAYMIGQERNASSLRLTDEWPTLTSAPDTQNTDVTLLDQRADIQAAAARTAQAMEARKLAESLQTRDITVGVQYEHYPDDSRNTVGAAVSIPLFTNYQYQGEIARAEVNLTTAEEARQQTQAIALGEISRARADLNAAIDKVRRYDEQMLAEAKTAADAAEFAYQHGAMGVTDLLDARRVYRTLQLDAANARADYAKSLAAWQAATQPQEAP
ncbi:TolC family protein [Methylovorus menthalis]|uniref:TolC family protein n=1 Tax=Methylovorus menthalis TaxID=1002227 RepID=UPI001E358C05|nr:TolC family protein [Methylovorus menthalis]MCB4811942.1 TolC family protein [Methylovorus menthalis]